MATNSADDDSYGINPDRNRSNDGFGTWRLRLATRLTASVRATDTLVITTARTRSQRAVSHPVSTSRFPARRPRLRTWTAYGPRWSTRDGRSLSNGRGDLPCAAGAADPALGAADRGSTGRGCAAPCPAIHGCTGAVVSRPGPGGPRPGCCARQHSPRQGGGARCAAQPSHQSCGHTTPVTLRPGPDGQSFHWMSILDGSKHQGPPRVSARSRSGLSTAGQTRRPGRPG
jgi:hypothetical protein